MAKPTGFLEYRRVEPPHRPVAVRVRDFAEVEAPHSLEELTRQAARCMDCGTPFCHGVGCPLGNRIPEFNDLVYRGRWREASEVLHLTNNFPEFTGRLCPAPCEMACTLRMNDEPVLIRHIECQIVERAFAEGWLRPQRPARRSGRRVAVVGSGPAGLAAAQQLARAGHDVVVFEQADRLGGLLRYGIPDFKLSKVTIDRRLAQLAAEGVQFQPGVLVGEDISTRYLRKMFDAVCLTLGAGQPRDLSVPGRDLENVVFAVEYLAQQNRLNAGLPVEGTLHNARDQVVAVIGGGDTGSDCVGTAIRQGARAVHQFEILPRPPEGENPETPWPNWPRIMRSSTSHEEGCARRWSVTTKQLSGAGGINVHNLIGGEVEWYTDGAGRQQWRDRPGTEFSLRVDLVILAMGFMHVVHEGLVRKLDLDVDPRGNLVVDRLGLTTQAGVFAAGDTVSGASLVVRAIQSGRAAAAGINAWLAEP